MKKTSVYWKHTSNVLVYYQNHVLFHKLNFLFACSTSSHKSARWILFGPWWKVKVVTTVTRSNDFTLWCNSQSLPIISHSFTFLSILCLSNCNITSNDSWNNLHGYISLCKEKLDGKKGCDLHSQFERKEYLFYSVCKELL